MNSLPVRCGLAFAALLAVVGGAYHAGYSRAALEGEAEKTRIVGEWHKQAAASAQAYIARVKEVQAETEENARQDRIEAYLTLLSLAVQHAVDALVMVNEQWGVPVKHKGGLWFEFDEEIKVDKARAERDKIYADMGYVRFTKNYYEKVLGFEPEHYELAETPDGTSPRGDGVSENGAASLAVRLSDGQAGGLSPTEAADRAVMQPKIAAILAALAEADGYEAFQTALNGMDLSEGDLLLVDRLVGESVRAFAEGME